MHGMTAAGVLGASALVAAMAACGSTTSPAAIDHDRSASIVEGMAPAAVATGDPSGAPASGPEPGSAALEPAAPTVQREPWTFGDAPGFVLVTPNYRLNTTIVDEPMLRELPLLMEAALRHYASELVRLPMPTHPLRSSIFAKRSEWAAHTKRRMPRDADTYLAIGRGGYTTDGESALFDIGREDTFTIALHEGWHQFTQTVFKDRLPVWLEEGIACWMEGMRFRRESAAPTFMPWRNVERFGELREAARSGRLVPFAELLKSTPQEALGQGKGTLLTYYAQVWALVHFLNEGEGGRYRDALRQVVADAAAGRLVARLVNSNAIPSEVRHPWLLARGGRWVAIEYLNADLDELGAQYDAFVRQIVASGNGQRVWRGESPTEKPVDRSAEKPVGKSVEGPTARSGG
ncbi:MAG: hypothetical protein U0575_11695 [Phycisphaerales bacterium]